ncbi:FAD-dependent oxidoreductase [Planococcus salinarum]|uniref:FAD-dependent oxidoreductase n=1 Tax=Planococcus salinarum TaxID=622695 RepID=UPI000E3B90BC|nr:FAD-dependent oxidoreductase [Planococcus salinarum]TAA70512.1 pyridine nucleotide-disulfide oxidoreductase [Planococcus salinarum]
MQTLVLVGGGHAHLHSLEQFKKEPLQAARVVLISPSIHQYYSGMFSGFAEGVYSQEDIRIDLNRFCEQAGAEFILDSVVAIDAQAKELTGADGAIYGYDRVSFDIGSLTAVPGQIKEHVSSIKPNFLFPEQLLRVRDSDAPVIVGGGASGVELAFSILAWRSRQNRPVKPLLFSSSALLSGQGNEISRKIEAIADRKGLPFHTDSSIEEIDGHSVTTNKGESFPQSDILWLTGPKSSGLFRRSGMPTDSHGFLLVNDALQNMKHPDVFGAGDCVTIDRYPALAKNGVYAVRQGPILWQNLKNSLASDELQSFVPQKRFVAILSTGDGEAFLSYGNRSLHGALPWKLKKYIDRKFMSRYKNP